MELKIIIQNETSQIQRNKYHILLSHAESSLQERKGVHFGKGRRTTREQRQMSMTKHTLHLCRNVISRKKKSRNNQIPLIMDSGSRSNGIHSFKRNTVRMWLFGHITSSFVWGVYFNNVFMIKNNKNSHGGTLIWGTVAGGFL